MKKLLIFIVLALFIGCGGGSGGGSSTSSDKYDINFVNTTEPVKVEDKKVSGNIYLNKLQPIVNENTKTKFKIKNFSILPSNPKREIAKATLDNSYADIDITDKNNIPYEVEFKNNNCISSFDIKMNIEAVITYTDVGSSTTKTFTKTYSVEIEQSAKTKPEIEHLILIPSSIEISPEEASAKKITVYAYVYKYNHFIKHSGIERKTPFEKLKEYYKTDSDIFKKTMDEFIRKDNNLFNNYSVGLEMAGCRYILSMLDFGCDGTATVTITAPAQTKCTLKWNKKVKYEC